ncbi:MAG: glycosyltransferase family 2 protein [Gemmatimonadales bacterium]|nr:glycosyltransferase family 2 protein [Gemmatimonadales bacterium]
MDDCPVNGLYPSEDNAIRQATVVVVPAYREERVVGATIAGICAAGWRVVLVDDGSDDGTASAAAAAGATVLRHPVNLGQGAALRTGFAWALRSRSVRYVVTFDADGQHSTEAIDNLVQPLAHDQVDVTLGSRFLESNSRAAVPATRRLLLHTATRLARWTTDLALTDTHNGLRAFRIEALRCLDLRQDRMAHASEILAEIARHRLTVREVSVQVAYTDYSRAKGQSMIDAVSILWDLIISRAR